jgi:hypothetical protein
MPWDQTLGVSSENLTPAAQEITSLAVTQESFGKAANRTPRNRTPYKLTGLRVSEPTVERATEKAGERLAERLHRGAAFGPQPTWKWNVDRSGRRVPM